MNTNKNKFLGPRGMFFLIIAILFIWFEINSFSEKYDVIMKRKISLHKSASKSSIIKKLPDQEEISIYLSLDIDEKN